MPVQSLVNTPFKLTDRSLGLLFMALSATSSVVAADADPRPADYDIQSQSLDKALVDFSLKSGVQVVADGKLTAGLKSSGVSGHYAPEQALQKLLAGTGLTVLSSKNGTVTLEKTATAAPEPQSSGTTLPTVTVSATADAELSDANGKNYAVYSSKSATRTDTPIMQTPQSIQVVKRSVIDDQQNITVSESLRNVSGVIPTNPLYTPSADRTRIRGFAAEQLIDGFTQYYSPGDRESTVNVERIEVLKGNNAILYSGGSGSPVGGVVNIVSKLPKAQAFGEVGVKIGTNDFYQPFVDINQPLHKNVLFRFTGEYTNTSNFIDTVNTKRFNINPTLTFTNNDSTTFTLQGKVSHWDQPEYQGLPANGTVMGKFSAHRKSFIGPADIPDSHSEFNAVWGTLDHKFNDVWSLNVKARYANSQFDEKVQTLFGADGFVADRPFFAPSTWLLANAELYQEQEERSFLGNVTAKFDLGPTKNTVLFGADHSDFIDKGYIDADFGAGFGVGSVDLNNPKYTAPYKKAGLGVNNMFVDNVTYGGYSQWQSTVFDRFHLLTSVRIAHVGVDFENTTSKTVSTANKTKVLPRVGAMFDVTDEFSLFINYSEGLRGQPFVNFVSTAVPEDTITLEGGLKFDFAHQLTGQVVGYQIDRSHVAVTDNTDVLQRAKAAGQQRSVGFETDVVWQATDALSFIANYAHTDAEFTDNLAGVPQGNKLALVPQNSGRLWANYRFSQEWLRGFSIGGGLYAQSEAFLSNNNNFKSDGYHTFDASLSYEQKNFKVSATVKNLTDEDYYQAYGYFDGRVIPSQGTSAYFTASVKY